MRGLARRLMLLLMAVITSACDPGTEDAQRFQITEISIRTTADQLNAEIRLGLQLKPSVRTALQRGVPITLKLQSRTRRQACWVLCQVHESETAWQLRYQPLSEHYIVDPLSTDNQDGQSFPRLRYALAELSRQQVLVPLADFSPGDYVLAVRVIFDVHHLPTPMRLPALIDPDWKLNSDWTEWPFRVNG